MAQFLESIKNQGVSPQPAFGKEARNAVRYYMRDIGLVSCPR
jgi:hypothetical protein